MENKSFRTMESEQSIKSHRPAEKKREKATSLRFTRLSQNSYFRALGLKETWGGLFLVKYYGCSSFLGLELLVMA